MLITIYLDDENVEEGKLAGKRETTKFRDEERNAPFVYRNSSFCAVMLVGDVDIRIGNSASVVSFISLKDKPCK